MQPHEAHRLERHQSAKQGSYERDKAAEDWDGTCDDVGDQDAAASAAQPDDPVGDGVVGEVAGAAEEANEDVLGGELGGESVLSRGQGK